MTNHKIAQRIGDEAPPIDNEIWIDLPAVIQLTPYYEGQNFLKDYPNFESFSAFEFPRKGDPDDDPEWLYSSSSTFMLALAIQKVMAATEIDIAYLRRYLRRESIAAAEEISLRNKETIYRAVTAQIGLEREHILVGIQY